MNNLLLLACSKSKNELFIKGKAIDLYTGSLFLAGKRFAEENKLKILILSAKYGFIEPETEIDNYNEKFKKPYSGPFPEGSGFYLGGPLYFKNAPDRFQSLVPPGKLGDMISLVREKLKDQTDLKKVGSKTYSLYEFFRDGKHTKEEAYEFLCSIYGVDEKMRSTINTQLSNVRMGKERNGQVFREGNLYYFKHNS